MEQASFPEAQARAREEYDAKVAEVVALHEVVAELTRRLAETGRELEEARRENRLHVRRSQTHSAWGRFAIVVVNQNELVRKLQRAQRCLAAEPAHFQLTDAFPALEQSTDFASVRSTLPNDLYEVAQAYVALDNSSRARETLGELAKQLAILLRTNFLGLWTCQHGGGSAKDLEALLEVLVGERQLRKENFWSQWKQAFSKFFESEGEHEGQRRRRAHPRNHGATGAQQPSAGSEGAAAEADETQEQASSSSGPAGSASATAASGSESPVQAATPLPVGLVQRATPASADTSNHATIDELDEEDEALSFKTFPRMKLNNDQAEAKVRRKLLSLEGKKDTLATSCAHRIEELYQTHGGLPNLRDLLVSDTRKLASNTSALRHMMQAVWLEVKHPSEPLSFKHVDTLLKEFLQKGQEEAVAQCCWHLEDLAERTYLASKEEDGCDLANDVLTVLLETMASLPENREVQKSALNAMWSVARVQERVLGFCSSQDEVFKADLLVERSRIRAAAQAAAERHESCQEVAVCVLARTQTLDVVQAVASEYGVTKHMEEIYYHLNEKVKRLFWDPESVEAWQVWQFDWAKDLARQISVQQLGMLLVPSMEDLTEFLTKYNHRKEMQPRFLTSGLLSGAEFGILEPLKVAMTGKSEDLVESAFRAVYVLNDFVEQLAPKTRDMANDCAMAISSKVGKHSRGRLPCATYVVSAVAGAIGSLNRGRGTDCGLVLQHLLDLAEDHMGRWWEVKSFHHEVLWAIDQIFQGTALGEWEKQVCDLAVRLHRNWSGGQNDRIQQDREEAKVLELTTKILATRYFGYMAEAGKDLGDALKEKVTAFVWTS